MDNELEVIRHQMEEKRASLADKLEALESQVRETVHEATAEVSHIVEEVKSTVDSVTEGVQETVATVKDTVTEGVQNTVETVKQTLNVNDHIRQHPWLAMGGAFAAGFAGAYLLGSSAKSREASGGSRREEAAGPESAWSPTLARRAETPVSQAAPAGAAGESSASAAFAAIEEAGAEAMTKVRELAVGTLMSVLGQVVANNLPEFLKEETSKLMTDLTTKLGGKVLDVGSAFEALQSGTTKGEGHDNGNETEMGRPMGSAQREGQEPLGQSDRRRADEDRGGLRANDRFARRANGKES